MAFLNSQWISFRALTSLSSAFWLFALALKQANTVGFLG